VLPLESLSCPMSLRLSDIDPSAAVELLDELLLATATRVPPLALEVPERVDSPAPRSRLRFAKVSSAWPLTFEEASLDLDLDVEPDADDASSALGTLVVNFSTLALGCFGLLVPPVEAVVASELVAPPEFTPSLTSMSFALDDARTLLMRTSPTGLNMLI